MSKQYTDITAEELKRILTFLNEKIHDFSTFKISRLPEDDKWETEHFSKDFSIVLKIDRNKFKEQKENEQRNTQTVQQTV